MLSIYGLLNAKARQIRGNFILDLEEQINKQQRENKSLHRFECN